MIGRKKRMPENMHPEANELFDRLLKAMAKPVEQTPQEEPQISDEECHFPKGHGANQDAPIGATSQDDAASL
jgi:hypothetical protein